jgi:ribosomal protein S17E
MGRIKSTAIKTAGDTIYDKGKTEFSENFDQNKTIVGKYAQIPSKKLRNKIVGHICRKVRKAQEEK